MQRISKSSLRAIVMGAVLAVAPAHGATLEKVACLGFAAYRLSDGRSEAIIVPSVGLIMRYGLVGGDNFLWNAPPGDKSITQWNGWGGDKTWLAPQALWPLLFGRTFPPDPAWDKPQRAQVLPGARLRLTGAVSSAGVRLTREFSMDAGGNLLIAQTAEKVRGCPMLLALWADTQIAPCDAVYLPITRQSIYKGDFCWMTRPKKKVAVKPVSATRLEICPEFSTKVSDFYKIGVDAPTASLVAVKDGVAFVQRASRPPGDYADSSPGGGLAVQYFHHGHKNPLLHYDELELLGPLHPFHVGSRWTHVARWSLHRLPSGDLHFPATQSALESLLKMKG